MSGDNTVIDDISRSGIYFNILPSPIGVSAHFVAVTLMYFCSIL